MLTNLGSALHKIQAESPDTTESSTAISGNIQVVMIYKHL